jgi:hypothetical protein
MSFSFWYLVISNFVLLCYVIFILMSVYSFEKKPILAYASFGSNEKLDSVRKLTSFTVAFPL